MMWRAVARLKHCVLVTDIGGRSDAKPANQSGREIRENVAKDIFHHHHVEIPRPAHHQCSAGIDVNMTGFHIWEILCALIEDRTKIGIGFESVGLVDAGQQTRLSAFLAPLGEPEREIEQALRRLAGNYQGLASLVLGDDALAHRCEQTFGRFSDQYEIDAAYVRIDDWTRYARDETGRSHAGVKVENET